MELGSVTVREEEGLFTIQPKSLLPYEKKDSVWLSISLERSLHMKELSRTIYTAFDFVSDVGGLSGFMLGTFTIIVGIWNYNSFDNTMAS